MRDKAYPKYVTNHYEFYDESGKFICSCDCDSADYRETIEELRSDGYVIE